MTAGGDIGGLRALAGVATVWAAISLACGSGSGDDDASLPTDDAAANTGADGGQCPATVALTVGTPCDGEGLQCAPEYLCNLVQVPLLCTCSGGSFVCTDSIGHRLEPGETPGCPPVGDAGCPVDEESADGTPCADVGFICEYPSACNAGVDSCQCVPSGVTGGASFVFACQAPSCGSPDSGVAGGDGGEADAAESMETSAGGGDERDADVAGENIEADGGVDATLVSDAGAYADATIEGGALGANTDATNPGPAEGGGASEGAPPDEEAGEADSDGGLSADDAPLD